jgi:MSHA biogenesis protein MshK
MAQRLIALSVLALTSYATLAQALNDPMRPPSASNEVSPGGGGGSRLQSVLISSNRSVAVIDGRAVRLGERVGDATVVAIEPAEVTLQRGAERQTLKLHAGIEKKPVRKVEP